MREPSRDKGRLEDIILIHSRGQQLPLAELQSVAYPTSVGHQAPSFRYPRAWLVVGISRPAGP